MSYFNRIHHITIHYTCVAVVTNGKRVRRELTYLNYNTGDG